MPPAAVSSADQCVVFVRAPGRGVHSIRHLPADVSDSDLCGHIELATGIVADRFAIACCDGYSLDLGGGGGGGGRARSAARSATEQPQQLTKFVSIDLRAGASSALAGADEALGEGDGAAAERGRDDREPPRVVPFSDMFVACHRGDMGALEAAFGSGSRPFGSSRYGNTLLHAACSQDQLAAVSLLLAMGVDTAERNWAGETPVTTARRLGAKACERFLRQFEQTRAFRQSSGRAPSSAAAAPAKEAASPADERRRAHHDGRDERLSAEIKAFAATRHPRKLDSGLGRAAADYAFAGANTLAEQPFAEEGRPTTEVGATPTLRPIRSFSRATYASGIASGRPPSRKRSASLTPPGETRDESASLIRQRRTCNCPRGGKLAAIVATHPDEGGGCGDCDVRRASETDSRVDRKHSSLSGGRVLVWRRRRRRGPRKSVTFVGVSDSESSCSFGSSSSSEAASSSADEADGAAARASSRAFRKWLEKKCQEEQMSKLWRRQTAAAAAAAAVSGKPASSRQRHGIFILSSEAGESSGGCGPDPLGYATAYQRWLEKNGSPRRRQPGHVRMSASAAKAADARGASVEEKRPGDADSPSTDGRAPETDGGDPGGVVLQVSGGESAPASSPPRRAASYSRPFSYEEWLSLKAAAVALEDEAQAPVASEGGGRQRRDYPAGLSHADWLADAMQRRKSAGERLRKASARELEKAKFQEWAKMMNSKRKTFAEWCAEKQREAALRAAAAGEGGDGEGGDGRRTARRGRTRRPPPRGPSYESWLVSLELRELREQEEALARERAYVRRLLAGGATA